MHAKLSLEAACAHEHRVQRGQYVPQNPTETEAKIARVSRYDRGAILVETLLLKTLVHI